MHWVEVVVSQTGLIRRLSVAEGFRTAAAEMKKRIIPVLIPALALILALAAVIAQHSPAVRAFDKRVIARLFRGNTRFGFTAETLARGIAGTVTKSAMTAANFERSEGNSIRQ